MNSYKILIIAIAAFAIIDAHVFTDIEMNENLTSAWIKPAFLGMMINQMME